MRLLMTPKSLSCSTGNSAIRRRDLARMRTDIPVSRRSPEHGGLLVGERVEHVVVTGSPAENHAASRHILIVERPVLLGLLDAGAGTQVTVVTAPAGSGKTVLVRSWLEARGLADRAAWVSVERGERDPQRFWGALAAEVSRAAALDTRVDAVAPAPAFNAGALIARLTRALLAGAGITLSDDGLALLQSRTEGWAAGLRLAALSLATAPDPERFVREFSGSERTVAEYLIAEVLDSLPAEVRRLPVRTSILNRVNGALGDLLTGDVGTGRHLSAPAEAGAFVIALDAHGEWFRFHHLFADLLAARLRHSEAPAIPQLHLLAAGWHAQNGDVAEAISHALAADAQDLATTAGCCRPGLYGWTVPRPSEAATFLATRGHPGPPPGQKWHDDHRDSCRLLAAGAQHDRYRVRQPACLARRQQDVTRHPGRLSRAQHGFRTPSPWPGQTARRRRERSLTRF
jgi:hypothetical protein